MLLTTYWYFVINLIYKKTSRKITLAVDEPDQEQRWQASEQLSAAAEDGHRNVSIGRCNSGTTSKDSISVIGDSNGGVIVGMRPRESSLGERAGVAPRGEVGGGGWSSASPQSVQHSEQRPGRNSLPRLGGGEGGWGDNSRGAKGQQPLAGKRSRNNSRSKSITQATSSSGGGGVGGGEGGDDLPPSPQSSRGYNGGAVGIAGDRSSTDGGMGRRKTVPSISGQEEIKPMLLSPCSNTSSTMEDAQQGQYHGPNKRLEDVEPEFSHRGGNKEEDTSVERRWRTPRLDL